MMKINRKWFAAACSAVSLCLPIVAEAHSHESSISNQEIFKSGDWTKIQAALDAELKEHPQNTALKALAQNVKKIIQREKIFEKEQNPDLAGKMSKSLRSFYYRFGMWNAAEKLDLRMCELKPGKHNALLLGQTQLNAGRNKEALTTLSACKWDASERAGKLCTALALARNGQVTQSREILGQFKVDELKPQERMIHTMAVARLGDADAASAGIEKLLANAPGKETAGLRVAFSGEDFASLLKNEKYQTALRTQSKAGSDCGGCPNRGTSHCGGSCK